MRYEYRHGSNKTRVQVDALDIQYPEADEQYDLVVCHYTKAMIPRKEAVVLGAVIPQVHVSYLCHPLAGDARKLSVQCLQEFEQNCNTCRHLRRVDFNRARWKASGLQPGECLNEARKPLYPRGGDKILFAPDDCMLQACYEGRAKPSRLTGKE